MRVLCVLALVVACGDDGVATGGPPIARSREITSTQRATYGGTGPMTREPDHNLDSMCRKAPR